ncbi:BatA domain-containing protein [Hymenobacter sp. DG25B]|uniref:BatA domain-containing protein n=1 Tax=Hymenobacter sp. DG25B TaxID=1385664 RepID=UPI0009006AA1|nr:BatA domain-containing protein [Hymenobacter sp. DG25B]
MALVYPWFLIGLLSLAIPIAIHFFELRRVQRIAFTNVSFIREVKLISARQRKLRHLLVLLARLSFLFFLVLLFCQPFIPAPERVTIDSTSIGVLVDTSPSMQAHTIGDALLLDKAVELGSSLTSALSPTAQFYLPSVNSQPLSPTSYKEQIEKLAISGHNLGLTTAINQTRRGHSAYKQLFLFSDFQKSSLAPNFLASVDSTQQVYLVPIRHQASANVYVDSVILEDAFVRTGVDIPIKIRLRNGGSEGAVGVQVKVFIGQQQVSAYQADIPAAGMVISTVRVRLKTTDIQQCRIQLDDEPISFDNTYYFTLQPSTRIRIVDIAARQTPTQQVYGNEPLFDYSFSSSDRINYQAVAGGNLTVVQELTQVPSGLVAALKRNVSQGGSVLIIPSADVKARASYDRLFRELGVGFIQWNSGSAGTPVQRELAAPNQQNPFFREVFAKQSRPGSMPKAAPVLRWARSGQDILKMRDGDGYLAEFPSGAGKVYVLAAPLQGGFSDFSSHALFVPVMYRLAMQSYQATQLPAYRLTQGSVTLPVPTASRTNIADKAIFKLQQDSNTFIPTQRVQAGELVLTVPAGMKTPGFYTLTQQGRPVTTLAFNQDKRESELASYSVEELRQLIGTTHPNIHLYDVNEGQSVAAQYKAQRVGTPLWQYCLAAALASLLLEVLLLRFWGKPKEAAVQPVSVA